MLVILLFASIAPIFWGTTFFVTTEFLPDNASFWISFWRACPIGLAWLIYLRHWPKKEWWGKLLIISACNIGIFFPLLFLSANLLPKAAGLGTMIVAFQPIPLAFLIWWWIGRKPQWQTWLSIAISAIGMYVLLDDPHKIINVFGILAALGCVCVLSIGTVLVERWGIMDDNISAYTAWQLLLGGLMIAPMAYFIEGPCPNFFAEKNGIAYASLYGILFVTICSTGIAYWVWFWSLKRISLLSIAMLSLLGPIVAYFIDVFYQDLGFTITEGIGICLVLAGLIYQGKVESAKQIG